MTPVQVADKTWEILREEGAVIEEALEEDSYQGSLEEKVVETATSPNDAVAGTSFNEKSEGLYGHQTDVVDIHPDDHPDGGQGLL